MPANINVPTIEDLKRHYKDEHSFNFPTGHITILNQRVCFTNGDGIYQISFCFFCGKEFIVKNLKPKLDKIIHNIEEGISLSNLSKSYEYADNFTKMLDEVILPDCQLDLTDKEIYRIINILIMMVLAREDEK